MNTITEGAAVIQNETADVVSKDLPVFYNPVMQHNRDVSILLLRSEQRKLQCCDLLAGSGVRSIRLLKEAPEVIENITINDGDAETYDRIKQNLGRNEVDFVEWGVTDFLDHSIKQEGPGNRATQPLPPVIVSAIDGSQLLLSSNGYDYIEIDPFGSPNAFLDAACKRIARNGILALTFTDTSALAGSYPDACLRKYWGKPTEGARIHEVGLRLLVRKVQLVGAQYDKALTPLLVYNHDHYYRAYFRASKGKKKCDELLAQHGSWGQEPEAGPLWLGALAELTKIDELISLTDDESISEWLGIIKAENELAQPANYHYLNYLIQETGVSLKKEKLLELLGDQASGVHYEGNAIKTSLSGEEIIAVIRDKKQ